MTVSAKSTYFALDDSAGTLIDLSSRFESVEFGESIDALPSHTFGDNSKEYILGLKGGDSVPLAGPWDETIEAHLRGIYGSATSKTFNYGPAGSGSGSTKLSGECHLTNYRRTNP